MRAGGEAEFGSRRGGRGSQPVALPVEGVGGEVDRAGPWPADGGVPVDVLTVDVGGGGGGEEAGEVAFVAAQRPDRRAGFDGGGQDGVGAGFDEEVVTVLRDFIDGSGELDGGAQVVVPVLGVECRGVDGFAAQRGIERYIAGLRFDVGEHVEKFVAQDRHVRCVGGVVDRDLAGADVVGFAVGEEFVEGVDVSGDDGGSGSVVGGDVDASVPCGQEFAGVVGGEGE